MAAAARAEAEAEAAAGASEAKVFAVRAFAAKPLGGPTAAVAVLMAAEQVELL